uniref:Uncharacterized protein n=1 Tax=Dulem virus 31 TaxID=3145749 RepID=A0AAU8ATA2_9VIRU
MAKAAVKGNEEKTTATNSLLITYIKFNKNDTAIVKYRKTQKMSIEEITHNGQDGVTDDFMQKFNKAKDGFIECMPLLRPDRPKISMNVIEFFYDKSDYLQSALYSVKYAFNDQNNAVINISTPPLPIYKEGMENTFCISGKDEEALHDVIESAKAYINGDTRTKQMKLIVDNT